MRDRTRTYDTHPDTVSTCSGGSTVGVCLRALAVPLSFSGMLAAFSFLFILLFSSPGWSVTPSGTIIANVATATYTPVPAGSPVTVTSPAASVTSVVRRTTAVIEFLQYAPEAPGAHLISVQPTAYSPSADMNGPFISLSAPVPAGATTPIDLTNPVPLVSPTQYHAGEPVFIHLTDGDQNNDPAVAETIVVTIRDDKTGDTEVLRLTETGPNAGVFFGYVQSSIEPAAGNDGYLGMVNDSNIIASYVDASDPTDSSSVTALVDPYGIVFNSMTGQPVDGAIVTLVNITTGSYATVYGDDGISTFPSALTTGGTAVDSSGRNYSMSPGGYRFPFISPGRYRLDVIPPAGYRSPSNVATAVLQALPGAPFAIAEPGSRSEEFLVNAGPAIHIDIPADSASSQLYLIKSAGKDAAAIGDFIPYKLTVENIDATSPAMAVTITDRLPNGFRYRKGSARLNNVIMAEPALSEDGRSIAFTIGDLTASASADVGYVAEVGAGANLGKAVNSAIANGSYGAVSNTATAAVLVTEDLYMTRTTIVGRVLEGCKDAGRGIEGVRIFLEDGSFVITDKNGMYHFAAVPAGTHVVQLDTVTVPKHYEPALCEDNTRYAGRSFSQFVDLQGGSLWRADFHLGLKPRPVGEVGLELKSALVAGRTGTPGAEPDSSYDIAYDVPLHVGSAPVRKLRLVVMLPDTMAYESGSSRMNAGPFPDPESTAGVLIYRLGEQVGDRDETLRFKTSVPAAGTPGELVTKAFLIFDTPEAVGEKTPVVANTLVRYLVRDERTAPDVVLHPRFDTLKADLTRSDKKAIETVIRELQKQTVVHITVTGHTDAQKIRQDASQAFPDNYALSRGRAQTVGRLLAERLALSPDQISIIGKGPDVPVATNLTADGRALNRRVELAVNTRHASQWTGIKSVTVSSGMETVSVNGLLPGESGNGDKTADTTGNSKTMPDYAESIDSLDSGNEWLWPPLDKYPAIASIKVAIKHDPADKVTLLLNNEHVDQVYADGLVRRSDNAVAISLWRGIHLMEGDNQLEALIVDASGKEVGRLQRNIHYSGQPTQATLVPERSRLIANGRDPIVLAVRFVDKDGHPAREGVLGEYLLAPPYLARQRADELKQSPLIAPAADRLKYTVNEDGVALIELTPTTQTGEAVLRFPLADGSTREIRTWLKPEDRDWVLVGLAEGTVGYNVVKGNMETFTAGDGDDKYYEEDRLAFYAKGRIKGEWLLTLAYDSRKSASTDQPGMYQTIDPNKYYTLYGDGTIQGNDAASARHIYIKLERDQFYALFGDFNAGLSYTELSRYNRNLTGFKSEMKTRDYEYSIFVADTNQAYVRDEFRGDGTSGLYHLSRKNIVLNSETITIETRDRFKSEVILSSWQLTNHLDYTIDYDAGTIFFKLPVFSRDGDFNPLFIVAEYESFDDSDTKYNYGGRAAVRFLDGIVEVGASHIHEGQVGGSGNLEGVDAKVKLGAHDELRAEAATTRSDQAGVTGNGDAYLAELQHRSETVEGKAYVREQQGGFGLGQQNGSESGTRKIGADLNYRINKPWTAGGEVFEQNNLTTGSVRTMAEVRSMYLSGRYTMTAGLRRAEDSLSTAGTQTFGETQRSDQIFAGVKAPVTDKTSVRINRDQSVGANDNVDFPTRTTVGADYKLNEKSTLFADQEWTQGSMIDTETTRIGIKTSPWTGGQIGSSMEQQSTENGVRLFSTTGLKQSWQITEQWSVDGGLDRSQTLHNTGTYSVNTNVPPASGSSEDFTASSLGAGYRQEKWSWTMRAEKRISDSADKYGLFTGANGEVRSGLGLAAGLQMFQTASVTGQHTDSNNLRLSLAYRPFTTRFIILDRFDYLVSKQYGGTVTYDDNQRVVNNLVANIKTNERTQISLQYASKYVQETIDENDYRGYTDLIGIEGRHDITKKWDIGLRGMRLRSWSINQEKYGTGASVGFNAGRNVWISVGYNFTGFSDRDFSKADFTSEGPFIKLRMKFDQVSIRDAVKWVSGQ